MEFKNLNAAAVFEVPGVTHLCSDQLGSKLVMLSASTTSKRYISVFDLATNQLTYQYGPFTDSSTSIVWVNSTHVVLNGTGTFTPYLFNINTNTSTNYSTAVGVRQQKLQQMVSLSGGSDACYISKTLTSGVYKSFILLLTGGSTITENISTANNLSCVTVKPTNIVGLSTSFLFGTDEGTIIETQTGSALNTITLPTIPGRLSSGPSPVAKLAWDDTKKYLYVTCTDGTFYRYIYTGPSYGGGAVAPTLSGQWFMAAPSGFTNDSMCISQIPYNGHLLVAPSYTNGSVNSPVMYLSNDTDPLMTIGRQDTTGLSDVGINSTANAGWFISSIGGSTNNYLLSFPLYDILTTGVDTEAQNPVPTDIAARIIRIAYYGTAYAKVELDTTIPSSLTTINSKQSQDYYEIALIGTPGVNEKYDARRFQT